MEKKARSNLSVAYLRVSTEEQARTGVSLDAQLERVEAYAKANGLELVAVCREEGVSASKPLARRGEGRRLVETVESGSATHVISLKLDRLFRDTVDALQTVRGWDHVGVSLHVVDLGGQSVNSGSALGRFFLGMLAGVAELERGLVAERVTTALAHKRAKGAVTNHAALGERIVGGRVVPDAGELRVVRAIERMRGRGRSYHRIAAVLNRAKVPTKTARGRRRPGGRRERPKWGAETVRKIVKRGERAAAAAATAVVA